MSAVPETTSQSHPRKPRKVGPFSRERSLSNVDGRTQAGRVLRAYEADLLKEIGPKATVAHRMLAKSAALKATRITLLTKKLLDDGTLAEGSDPLMLAWMNGLRADLIALGLLQPLSAKGAKQAKKPADALEAYLAGRPK